jgi:hypothetical protein
MYSFSIDQRYSIAVVDNIRINHEYNLHWRSSGICKDVLDFSFISAKRNISTSDPSRVDHKA